MLKLKALQLLEVIFLVAIIVLPVRFFLFEPFFVLGDSMLPNYENYDYLLIEKISYRFRQPQREDVVIFRPPVNPHVYYIKRVVGLPGETVKITGGQVAVANAQGQSVSLSEPYLGRQRTPGDYEFNLGQGEYFVLGDNRSESYDSRRWGPISQGAIVGRVLVRVVPLRELVKVIKVGFARQ